MFYQTKIDFVTIGLQHKKEIVVGKLEEIQAKAKENARSLSEENAKLASQLLHLQQQSACLSSGPLAAKELLLQDVLDHEAKLKEEVAVLEEKLTKVLQIPLINHDLQTRLIL